MVALGLVLLVLCLVVGVGIGLSNTESTSAEAFGYSLSDLTVGGLFALGAAVGAIAMLGLGLMLLGAGRRRAKKRAIKQEVQSVHGERESLAEENARLQAALEQERTAEISPAGSTSPERTGRGRHGR